MSSVICTIFLNFISIFFEKGKKSYHFASLEKRFLMSLTGGRLKVRGENQVIKSHPK